MMLQTDVAVVGAGPAGSIAAQRLAAAGVKVSLLEMGTFPRDKSCGDGVTSEGLKVLERSGLSPWASQFPLMKHLRLSSPDSRFLDIDLDPDNNDPAGRLIPRRLLDEHLAQQAVQNGADLRQGVHVSAVTVENGKARLHADNLDMEARLVILAEGSHSPLTRRMGLLHNEPELVALRQYLVGDQGPVDRMEIHYQEDIIPGYNWIFPMGDGHVNVGTGTYTHRISRHQIDLKSELNRFIADSKISENRLSQAEAVGPVQGSPLRTRLDDTQTHADGVLVAGDAAGLVNPFTGVGIAQAMRSGELAAEYGLAALHRGSLTADSLAGYTRALRDHYQAEQNAARFIRTRLSAPGLLNRIFGRLQEREELARLLGHIVLAKRQPQQALKLSVLMKLLF